MFLDDHQRATIAAAMARIIPTDDLPGASEAGTIDFVDRYLSGIEYIYALPDGSGFEVLEGKRADAWRRRVEAARKKYVSGVADLDRVAAERFGARFEQLVDLEQDAVLRELEHPGAGQRTISYGGPVEPVEPALQQTNAEVDMDFFGLLVTHTRQGFYSDPVYGGNHDRVGWGVIGFPGPSSLAEVHAGRYDTLDWFSDERQHPDQEGLE